jgi:dolichyl-phosphate-mannose--protein O-mannosyl transferase
MIVEEIKSIKSEKKELRQFGITMGIVLGLLGWLLLWREKDYYPYFLMLSVVLLFFGLVLPVLLKPLHKIWMTLALLIGWFVTRVIMIILFYLLVTPIGLLARLCRKNFLNTKIDRNVNSYWIPRKPIKLDKKNYENQF